MCLEPQCRFQITRIVERVVRGVVSVQASEVVLMTFD